MARRTTYEDISYALPTDAYFKGWRLSWMTMIPEDDPVYLRLQNQTVHEWDYIPSLTEVSEKIKELEVAHGN